MARKRDNAPVKDTCPLIDFVICVLHDCECNADSRDMFIAKERMEEIRKMNEELREWGNEQYNRAEELEGKVDALESEIESLREEQ